MSQAIKNVVFDFGGVVCDFKVREYFVKTGVSPADTETIQRDIFSSPEIEIGCNTGKLTWDEARIKLLLRMPEKSKLIDTFFAADTKNYLPLREPVLKYVQDLKKAGFGTYALTNLSVEVHNSFRKQHKGFDELSTGLRQVTWSEQ